LLILPCPAHVVNAPFHPPSTIRTSSSLSPYNAYTSRQSTKRHLPIRGGDLRGEDTLLVGRARGSAPLVQRQHLLNAMSTAGGVYEFGRFAP